jgi:cytochrome oxidase assembly protein ShyY1
MTFRNVVPNQKTYVRLGLLGIAVVIELGLLALGHWQWQRYQQRVAERAMVSTQPLVTLHGEWVPEVFAVLDNQPHPFEDNKVGWRVLGVLQTGSNTVVVDRGWVPITLSREGKFQPQDWVKPVRGTVALSGIWKPFPQRHGWLKGPDTATDPKILAFFNPQLLTNHPVGDFYLSAKMNIDKTNNQKIIPEPTPPMNPWRHLSYMFQWLGLSFVFPLLCWQGWRGNQAVKPL